MLVLQEVGERSDKGCTDKGWRPAISEWSDDRVTQM